MISSSDRKGMDSVSKTLSVLLLYILWKINIVYDRYFSKENGNSNSSSISTTNEEYEEKSRPSLSSFAKASGCVNFYDIMTPQEEEMLKFSCAKGYTNDGNSFVAKLRECDDEKMQIPRSMFTEIWIDTCIK